MKDSIAQEAISFGLAAFTVAIGDAGLVVNLGYAQYRGIRDDSLGYVLPSHVEILM